MVWGSEPKTCSSVLFLPLTHCHPHLKFHIPEEVVIQPAPHLSLTPPGEDCAPSQKILFFLSCPILPHFSFFPMLARLSCQMGDIHRTTSQSSRPSVLIFMWSRYKQDNRRARWLANTAGRIINQVARCVSFPSVTERQL